MRKSLFSDLPFYIRSLSLNVFSTIHIFLKILPGITRTCLFDICRDRGISIREKFSNQSSMVAADKVLLTGTVTEVLSVTRINNLKFGDGKPGPLARGSFGWLRESAGA